MSSTDTKVVPVPFKAGINRESTEFTTDGQWYDGNRVRFRKGRPENIRGWEKKVSSAYNGVARTITSWSSLNGSLYSAFATDMLLYIYSGGDIYDVTPINTSVTTSSTAPLIYSSTGNNKLLVDWVSQSPAMDTMGLTQNTFVVISAPGASVGGIDLNGSFRTSLPAGVSVNRFFKIITSTTATGNASTSASTNFTFLMNAGSDTQVEDLGYGTALWNEARASLGVGTGYGTPASTGTGFTVLPRNWSLSNWGEDLIACPRAGKIYLWSEDETTANRATAISSAPTQNTLARVSPLNRHMIAFGTMPITSVFDPLLVRWSDAEDYNNWNAAIDNSAGEQQLGDGSKIVGAVNSRNQMLIWTDNALHGMTYVGTPFVFTFKQLGTNCGLVGLNAAVEANGAAFWMSQKDFFIYDGSIKVLPCTVKKYIFDDINQEYLDKVFVGFNKEFSEVTWLYVSSDSTECDKYVTYNPVEQWWTYGDSIWTTWEDKKLYPEIMTTSSDSYLYDNEPDNVYTGDGAAIESFVQSGGFPFDAQTNGNNVVFIDRIIPDFNIGNDGNVKITVETQKYPQSSSGITKGPYTVDATTEKISFRSRGRSGKVKIERGSKANTRWRFGGISLDMMQDGQR